LEAAEQEKMTETSTPGKERSPYTHVAPAASRAFSTLDTYLSQCGIENRLLQLVNLRASMLNGCAYCLQMHSHDAIELGERIERLFQLGAWAESPVFSAREKAALAWTEAITLVSVDHVPDEVFERARAQFSEKELVNLTWAIVAINGWNRMSIAFRGQPEISTAPESSAVPKSDRRS
jgi:AhpD family alkylhydroperoxidase